MTLLLKSEEGTPYMRFQINRHDLQRAISDYPLPSDPQFIPAKLVT